MVLFAVFAERQQFVAVRIEHNDAETALIGVKDPPEIVHLEFRGGAMAIPSILIGVIGAHLRFVAPTRPPTLCRWRKTLRKRNATTTQTFFTNRHKAGGIVNNCNKSQMRPFQVLLKYRMLDTMPAMRFSDRFHNKPALN